MKLTKREVLERIAVFLAVLDEKELLTLHNRLCQPPVDEITEFDCRCVLKID